MRRNWFRDRLVQHNKSIRSRFSRRFSATSRNVRVSLESLEPRQLLTGSWTNLSASGSGPANGIAMMLLSDGSIAVQDGGTSPGANWYKLTPDSNGNYVNGHWTQIDSMNEARRFSTTATLPDGRIFVIGGEYPKFSNTAEIYDPVANTWTPVDPIPTSPTRVDLTGTVTNASNTSPITITINTAAGDITAALVNGDQVTVSGVLGNTAANGTFAISNVTSNSFQLVGTTGNGNYTSGGSWAGPAKSQYGDDPIVVLSNGQILAGYYNDQTTYLFNPAAAPEVNGRHLRQATNYTVITAMKKHGSNFPTTAFSRTTSLAAWAGPFNAALQSGHGGLDGCQRSKSQQSAEHSERWSG